MRRTGIPKASRRGVPLPRARRFASMTFQIQNARDNSHNQLVVIPPGVTSPTWKLSRQNQTKNAIMTAVAKMEMATLRAPRYNCPAPGTPSDSTAAARGRFVKAEEEGDIRC